MSLEVSVSATFSAAGAAPFEVDVDLSVGTGETLVVAGPSGSGKTLLLETVAGYHDHEGAIGSDGEDVTDRPPEDRDFGFVFQDHALFPHMTVRENVAFGTRYHSEGRDPDDLLAELGIPDLAERTPATLSGGEAQRVALARSLAIRPSTILLDEPLSSLDVPTRESLRSDLASILEGVTALYVTHDRTTARALGDRVAVMREGRVVQVGDPESVFERPASPFVARFTGSNCVPAGAWAEAVEPAASEDGAVANHGRREGTDGSGTALAIRPEHVVLGEGGAAATVERVVRQDVGHRVVLARAGSTIEANVATPPAVAGATTVRIPREHVTWFRDSGDPVP